MARDWNNLEAVRQDIFERMAKFGHNVAQFPYCETQERLENGTLVWTVDIHIKVLRTVEFELSASGFTVSEALRRVYLGLNSEANLRRTNGESAAA